MLPGPNRLAQRREGSVDNAEAPSHDPAHAAAPSRSRRHPRGVRPLTQPAVTLFDYGLALECVVLTWLALRERRGIRAVREWAALFFASVGVAALLAGTMHGFFLD